MPSIVDYIIRVVNPKTYWETVFAESGQTIVWPEGNVEPRLKSLLRDDKHPSFTVNKETGAWYDHGDDDGGNHIVSFHAVWQGVTLEQAAHEIYDQFVHPTLRQSEVTGWATALSKTPSYLAYLSNRRLLSPSVIKQFEIGTNGDRLTIPIRNEFGDIVNAKLYKPGGKPKMLNMAPGEDGRSFGSPPMLYPISVLEHTTDDEPIFICEGEWDALALLSIGVMAVTTTCGVKSWPKQYNELFRNRHVVITFDNDQDGEKYDKRVVRELSKLARTVKRLYIPKLPKVKDVTDWMHARADMRKQEGWLEAIADLPLLIDNPEEFIKKQPVVASVPLDMASRADLFGKIIQVDALVTGKDTAAYIVPEQYRVSCSKQCDDCPLAATGKEHRERTLDRSDPTVLSLIDVPQATLKKTLVSLAGLPSKGMCSHKIDVLKSMNLEAVFMIPALGTKSQYVMQPAFYAGHGIKTNRNYTMTGRVVVNPQDQHATQLFTEAKPCQDEIETFVMTPELLEALKVFQPDGAKANRVWVKMFGIAEWQSRVITKIVQRDDLHLTVDLVFHSANSFMFNGELVDRGMLDVLVLGDTRCGKGKVTERLIAHYGLGEVASGENCSFAGLVGGCESVGKKFMVKWGVIPLNNGRLVVIDEASALSEADFGKLSRVRSEGVAEINKIVREQTQANTRLLWLSNARGGRSIMSYNSGTMAIKELVGANEDISRFDFALCVATNEVPSEVINTVAHDDEMADSNRYPPALCRALILWAWSRAVDQVEFTTKATQAVIAAAVEFGKTYSSSIPLVQAENARIKIAKVSAAVAARVFSTNEDGSKLIIDVEHVATACSLLRQFYGKASMGYDAYSSIAIERERSVDPEKIKEVFDQCGEARQAILSGMIALSHISVDMLRDYAADDLMAKAVISALVQLNCLVRHERGGWYFKTPSFSSWLRATRRK